MEYYSQTPPSPAQRNSPALVSMIAGLSGWLLVVILLCFSLAVGLLTAATLGLGSVLAICALPIQVLVPIAWIVGVIMGHIGMKRVKDTGDESGRGFALTGLISSYIGLGLVCLLLVLVILGMVAGFSLPLLGPMLEEFSHLSLTVLGV